MFLHLTGKRADGYHLLESLMVFAEAGDVLSVAPSGSLSLEITGPGATALASEPPEKNLVMRAAQQLALLADVEPKAHIALEKHLPVGGGIGGGSTDAAATLKALCQLWQLNVPEAEVAALALSLGADVPVCLNAASTMVRGVGESLTPLPIPALHAVLVNPGVHISTRDIFTRTTGAYRPALTSLPKQFGSAGDLLTLLNETHNDLEPIACALAPDITSALEALKASTGCQLARMSGSGSTCFGLFADAAQAQAAAQHIAQNKTAWWICATRLF